MKSQFEKENIALSDLETALFEKLLASFLTYNAHTNLSAIRDAE